MSLVLEFLHEHALSIDFAMFVLIGLVQVIVYPVFREIPADRFAKWHPRYCNQIGWFVLPLMIAQLLDSASTCFFVADDLSGQSYYACYLPGQSPFLSPLPATAG